jgi:hypothetical protein
MNVDPASEAFADDRSLEPLRGWIDLWAGRPLHERATLPTRYGEPALQFPPRAFDRFIVSPDLETPPWTVGRAWVHREGVDIKNVHASGGDSNTQVSDHYPICVEVRQ